MGGLGFRATARPRLAIPDLPGGSRTGGGGLSLGGGGRGPERPGDGRGGAAALRDTFRCGSRGISSPPPPPGPAGGCAGPGLLGGGGGGAGDKEGGRGPAGTGGLLFCGGGAGAASRWRAGRLPTGGGGGGGGLSSAALLGVGGRGGRLEKAAGLWRTEPPPKAAPRLPGNGGGVGPGPGCRALARLCRPDCRGRGVLGTGGGAALSGLEPTSGRGGGIRFLWGSGGPLRWPGAGTGNRPGPLGGEKGLADVALAPGGRIGGRLPPESAGRDGEGDTAS